MPQQITKNYQALRTLLEKIDAVQASTRDGHSQAMYDARQAFEARVVQAVAYRVNQVMDAITSE